MKKRKLQTWKSNVKVIKVKTVERVVELKEDRSLFARLMMVCKSRPDIDIKEAICNGYTSRGRILLSSKIQSLKSIELFIL